MIRTLLLLGIIASATGLAHAQSGPAPAPAAPPPHTVLPPEPPTPIPAELVARVQEAETRDYRAARMALAASDDYNGYALATRERTLMEQWFALRKDRKATVEALEALAKRLAEELPLSYTANNALAQWYAERYEASSPRDPLLLERGRPHFLASEGIIASITGNGDGRSMDTAWQVIHIGEEYLTLLYLGYEPGDQSLMFSPDDRAFDVFQVTDSEGKERTVYFDITAFYGKGFD